MKVLEKTKASPKRKSAMFWFLIFTLLAFFLAWTTPAPEVAAEQLIAAGIAWIMASVYLFKWLL